jgi:hypothetical protein
LPSPASSRLRSEAPRDRLQAILADSVSCGDAAENPLAGTAFEHPAPVCRHQPPTGGRLASARQKERTK